MNDFIKERRNNFQSISKFVLALSSCPFLLHVLARLMSERCSCIM
jgi:hypothetical protein